MLKLCRITFVAWDGEPTPHRVLDDLPPPDEVLAVVKQGFGAYLAEGAVVDRWDGLAPLQSPETGLHLVYVYGHAWLESGEPQAAWRVGAASIVGGPEVLLPSLVPAASADRTVLVLDCCHAAAFDRFLVQPHVPRLAVYACAAEESAIALVTEQASRLSLALAAELSRARVSVDLVRAVAAAAEHLERDGVLHGQSVSYRMTGSAVKLARGGASGQPRRERTVSRVRRMLVAIGVVATGIVVVSGWFYWSHVLVDVDFAGLAGFAQDVQVSVREEDPATNSSEPIADRSIDTNRARLWLPASDLVLQVRARYPDGADRALNFHVLLSRGFDPRAKVVKLTLPDADAVKAHPNMAFVPAVNWYHGREREARTSAMPFWIDLRPPTVDGYTTIASRLMSLGALKEENSFILSWRQRSAAIDAVGLSQLRSLGKDLGEIVGVIEASSSSQVAAPGDIVVGTGQLPCATCPAPMTRLEAGLYCASRGMRVPTDLEWELAVRGVDGRVYPWGNRFDDTRANVPGLPQKGETSPHLKPVDAYPNERSPFGLVDTVGNAGDWVVNDSSSFERVYMGATYRFNPEDATAFRMLPVTESDALVREITVRCVADAVGSAPARK
jgi:hypothetical protein